jgi:spermidine synthase
MTHLNIIIKFTALTAFLLVSGTILEAKLENINGKSIFYEDVKNSLKNGITHCIHLDNAHEQPLHKVTSPYQEIEVYKTDQFGNMLVIDDIIMLTQFDNFAYHEMIAHVPLIAHPNPKRVLIVGGGDGGNAQQILKHPSIQEVVICDIDKEVFAASKEYFPELAICFDDQRLIVIAQDASQYIKSKENYFDVICVDSTDPIGPGEALFQQEFYQDLHRALTEDGIAVTQSEAMFFNTDLIADLYKQNNELFTYASYYYTIIPTYPSGSIGFSFCSKKYDPFKNIDIDRINALPDLKYYSKNIHLSSFVLPAFLQNKLTGIE